MWIILGEIVCMCFKGRQKGLRKLEKTQMGTLEGEEENNSHFRVRENKWNREKGYIFEGFIGCVKDLGIYLSEDEQEPQGFK